MIIILMMILIIKLKCSRAPRMSDWQKYQQRTEDPEDDSDEELGWL